MEIGGLVDLWRTCIVTAAAVCAPFLIAALAVGLLASLIQAATQMQEQVLSFVPKIVAVGLVLSLAGHWFIERLARYAHDSIESTVEIAKGPQE